jgi:dTDP-4-amino-4,6-dideoxygalactose transaminase
MHIGRTLPPAAAPIYPRDIFSGLKGLLRGDRELARFESELKNYFGMKHCFLVSSGKAALSLILLALKDMYPDRDEVLIPAFTCYSVPSAIVRAGLKVRLCDINPNTLDFDFDQLSKILCQCSPAKATNRPSPRLAAQPTSPEQQTQQTFTPCTATLLRRSTDPNSSNMHAATRNEQPVSRSRLLSIIPTHLFGLPADIGRLRDLVDDPKVVIAEDAAQAMGGDSRLQDC